MKAYRDAMAAFRSGDDARVTDLSQRALADARASGDHAAEVEALCMLARVALRDGDFNQVHRLATEAESLAAALPLAQRRMPLHLQAAGARMAGDLSRARTLYEQSIALNEELGNARFVASEQRNLAYVELNDGRAGRARELFAKAREGARMTGYTDLEPYLVQDEAMVAGLDGDAKRAAELLARAGSMLAARGELPDPDEDAEQKRLRARLAQAPG